MDVPFDLAVVCDDDPDIALAARLALRDLFKEIETLASPSELQKFIKARSPDAILLDLNFERAATDGSEGLDYLGRIMTADPEAAVVIITAHTPPVTKTYFGARALTGFQGSSDSGRRSPSGC